MTEFLTEAAAGGLKINANTLGWWRRAGKAGPPYIRVGKVVYYRPADLNSWLESAVGGLRESR